MLNYVWLGLLVLGIGVALTMDIVDQSNNKYRNGEELEVNIQLNEPFEIENNKRFEATLSVPVESFNEFYNIDTKSDVKQKVRLTVNTEERIFLLFLNIDQDSPDIWKEMGKIGGKEADLTGIISIDNIQFLDERNIIVKVVFENVSFANMKDVTNAALDYAGIAVEIALGLIGIMALWLGVMKVAEEAGLIRIIANAVRPITKFLFPDVPHDHPAMGSMIMNISANMLGLGNAATPFGLKAMEELDKLNSNKGTATNAMCTFLAVNTAGLTLLPVTAIAVRAAAGSANPAIIIGTAIFGASCATVVGITAAKIFEKFPIRKGEFNLWWNNYKKGLLILFGILLLIFVMVISGVLNQIFSLLSFISPELFKTLITVVSILAIPTLIFLFIGYGAIKKVKIYEVFVEGAKEGFDVAVRIIPYLVAMLVAIGIFRAGGGMDFLIIILKPFTEIIGMPAEALPMAIMRPLSGSGSLGIMAEIISVHGADSFIGILVSTFFGSTETTFYVLAVYFGAVNIRKTRHALAAGLLADVAGIVGAVFIVRLLFGG
ncbi:nucleoside recognition domain-containing protein [Bacteroidota bacterium]